MLRTIFAFASAAGLAACAPTLSQRPLAPDDPSNPSAPESVARAPSRTLDVVTAAEPDTAPPAPPAEQPHHHHGATEGEPAVPPAHDEGMPDSARSSGHEHMQHEMGANAGKKEKAPAAKPTYVCPMHPGVTSDHPGKCPKCGMTLVPKETKPGSQP